MVLKVLSYNSLVSHRDDTTFASLRSMRIPSVIISFFSIFLLKTFRELYKAFPKSQRES